MSDNSVSYDYFSINTLADMIKSGEKSFKHIDLSGMDLTSIALEGLEFVECLFDHAIFTRNNLHAIRFLNSRMSGAIFTNSSLTKCAFDACNLQDATFDGASFVKTLFKQSGIKRTNFTSAELDDPTIISILSREGTLKRASITNAVISDITIKNFKLINCTFENVTLDNVTFDDTQIIGCRFPMSTFSSCAFNGEECSIEGGSFSLANFEQTAFNQISIDKATRFFRSKMDVKTLASFIKIRNEVDGVHLVTNENTVGAQLGETTYINCDFSQVNLSEAWLYKSRFFRCNFNAAELSHVNLILSQFHQCDLSSIKLSFIRIHAAIFRDCNFKQSDWRLTMGMHPAFYHCDFSDAKGNWSKVEPHTAWTGSYSASPNRQKTYFKGSFSKVNFLHHQVVSNCPNFNTPNVGVFIEPDHNEYIYRYDKYVGNWDIVAGCYWPEEFGPINGDRNILSDNCEHLCTQSKKLFLKT